MKPVAEAMLRTQPENEDLKALVEWVRKRASLAAGLVFAILAEVR